MLTTIAYNLCYLREALKNFDSYLTSKASQWPLGKHHFKDLKPFPALTTENFLLARQHLLKRQTSPTESKELEKLEKQFQDLYARRRVAWGEKASLGFHHRLRLWQNFIDELLSNMPEHIDRYPYEVRLRVMLKLLKPDSDLVPATKLALLTHIDQRLQAVFKSGSFIWSHELEPAFPVESFWYLYGSPVS